MCENLFKVK
jgi:hypothetical protein